MYEDENVPNTPFADKLGGIDSIFQNGTNDTGKSKKLLGDTVKIEKGYVTGDFNAVVDAVFRGDVPVDRMVKMGETPKIIQDYGANDNPLTISQSEMYKIAYPQGYLGLEQGHNLGIPALKHLPEQLSDPVAILKSNTQKDKGRVILTEWNDKNNNPVIIALHINQQGAVEVENVIKSAYGKNNIEALLGENNENVIYTKNNEDIHQLLSNRLQLPEANTEDIFNNNLSQSEGIVNNNSMQNSDNNSTNSKKLLGEEVLPGTEINETAKSRTFREKAENKLVKDLSDVLSVPLGQSREFLKPIVQEITNEYLTNGKMSMSTINRLFDEGYKNGQKINDTLYYEYEDLRKTLKDTKVKVSDEISKSIPDYVDFRKRHIGNLSLNKVTGIEVDSLYEELSAKYPEFFEADVLNPADRLLKIAEVADSLRKKIETLDTYYKDDTAKADLKHEFEEAVSGYIESMINVKRYNDALPKDKFTIDNRNKFNYDINNKIVSESGVGYDDIGTTDIDGESNSKKEKGTGEIQRSNAGTYDPRRGFYGRRENSVETRTIKDVTTTEKFNRLASSLSGQLTFSKNIKLYEKYKNDTRVEDDENFYDIIDLATYDMLTDENNELRELFYDEIAEYFNEDTSKDADSSGNKITNYALSKLKKSVIRNKSGQLIPVYHSTNAVFDNFEKGDIGFHFGSYSQALKRAEDNRFNNPIFVKAYLNIKNPLEVDADFYGWNAFQIGQKLSQMGIITQEEGLSYSKQNNSDVNDSNKKLVSLLKSKGYDGIVYSNTKESLNSKSYIAFDNAQIFRVDNENYEVEVAYNQLYKLKPEIEKVVSDTLLTPADKNAIDGLLKGAYTIEQIPQNAKREHVEKVYEAKKKAAYYQNIIDEHNKKVREERENRVNEFLEDSDNWKDKKVPLFTYATETPYRNFLEVSNGNEEFAETFTNAPEINDALKTRFINEHIEKAAKLKLSVEERIAVQYLGETEFQISQLEKLKKAGKLNKRQEVELNRMKAEVNNFKTKLNEKNKLDLTKVNNAIDFFRNTYDEIHKRINETRIKNGYAPIGYIEGYFPHFINDESDTPFRKMMSDLGFEVETNKRSGKFEKLKNMIGIGNEVTELPTNIAGKTENFKPGITWNPNALRRLGKKTDFDAYYGFEKYITGAADVIFHTEDIQNIRTLERAIRYKYSDEGIKERINRVKNDTNMTEEDRQSTLNDIFESKSALLTKMGNFVNYLTDYGNQLANKKSRYDRLFENELGRKTYNVFDFLNKRFSANVIAGNIASAATNVIPIQQMKGSVSEKYILKGMCFGAYSKSDDYVLNNSTFIANRTGTEKLVKNATDEIEQFLTKPMEFFDMFTAKTVVKAKYEQNISKGMAREDALHDADRFAANLIASRTKASMPTIFGAKNTIAKTFTSFQVEVRNQYSYLFKDLPSEKKERGLTAIAWGFFKILLGSYLFNDVYEKMFGRRSATDVIGIANGMVGEATGYKLDNWTDIVSDILKGEGIKSAVLEKVKQEDLKTAMQNGTYDLAGELPFVGGVLGGGRLPGPVGFIGNAIQNKGISKDDALTLAENYLLPFGGTQVGKTVKGIKAVTEEGSYKKTKDGKKYLQYPINRNIENYTKAVLGGKNAVKGYEMWKNSGYTSLSPEETKIYEQMVGDKDKTFGKAYSFSNGLGADKYNVYNAMMGMNLDGIKKQSANDVHEYIKSTDGLNDKQKSELEYLYLSDTNKEKIYWLKRDGKMTTKRALQMRYDLSPELEKGSLTAKSEYYKKVIPENTRNYISSTTYKESDADLKRFALLYNKEYSPTEKAAFDEQFIGDLDRKRDYTSENAYFYSMLSESQQKRYDKQKNHIKKLNMMSYYYYLTEANQQDKKTDKIRVLMENGMTASEATNFYLRVMSSSKKYK